MYDYEKLLYLLYDSLLIPGFYNQLNHTFETKHLWVKKATGSGVTEYCLRLTGWLSPKEDTLKGLSFLLVTDYVTTYNNKTCFVLEEKYTNVLFRSTISTAC